MRLKNEVSDFKILDDDAQSIIDRATPPPVDLSKPISGELSWNAIFLYAQDHRYQRAANTVRLRYQLVANPMLLPNTLREVMQRSDLGFREAMLRVAEDDGIGPHR